MRAVVLLLFAFLVGVSPATAAPAKARSLSGSGVLLLSSDSGAKPLRLVLYREPGIGRVAELDAAQLPHITPAVQAEAGWLAAIVTAKKPGWYRIVYDDGEREGWLLGGAAHRYQRWEELLPGRVVTVPAGLRKEFYLLRSGPDPAAAPLETISRESRLTVLAVAGDWMNVGRNASVSGWLRWQDDNGRLLITVNR